MRWIKSEKYLPKDREMVIFVGPNWKYWDCGIFDAEKRAFVTEATYGYDDEPREYSPEQATHWMPQSAIRLPKCCITV